MKFDGSSFGMLVRPRILAKTQFATGSSIHVKSVRESVLSAITGKTLKKLFSDLPLGNTSEDLSNCYVGEIVSLMVLVSEKEDQTVMRNITVSSPTHYNFLVNKHGKLYINGVGLKFYKGMARAGGGKVVPNGILWEPTAKQEWFYCPHEVVPIDNIIKYESCKLGDFVESSKSKGLVVDIKQRGKPKFYSTSSWSCCQIVLLGTKTGKPIRLLPSRNKLKILKTPTIVIPTCE